MNSPLTIAYIFDCFPYATQTFFRREIAGLRQQGLRVELYSLVRLRAANRQPALDDLPVDYFRWWEPVKLFVALPRELRRDRALLRDGWRLCRAQRFTSVINFIATFWAVAFAVCRAQQIRARRPHILHGVWADEPATAAALLGRLCGVPFSFGAQAHDIYQRGGDAFLEPKLRAASFVHTTTAANVRYLRDRANGAPAKIILARRGLAGLPERQPRVPATRPIRLLSVARLVPKKGHTLQLAACALLKTWGVPFVARIVGGGWRRGKLRRAIQRAGLADSVSLCGELPPARVAEHYQWADIFWHTGVVDARGDRDGLPNVIPEAFAHQLPVISSPMPGAIEAVTHETTGLLVDVTEAGALATAVKRLAEDFALRQRLGENGRRWVEENFLIEKNGPILARAFHEAVREVA